MLENEPQSPSAQFARDFAELAPALHAWAYLRVRGALRQRLDPDDLVQEIAVRACLRAADYDSQRGTFRQWIFGFAIALSCITFDARSLSRRCTTVTDDAKRVR